MKVTILGSGTSHGVPMIGCACPVCTSTDSRNHRHRASALVELDGRNILIDTAIELRLQAVAQGIERIDAVLFTHEHADHIHGFDDLRRFCSLQRQCIPCYGNRTTVARLRRVFDYVLSSAEQGFYGIPVVDFRMIDGPFELFGHCVTPVPLVHGQWPCFGYRFGRFAYCTDVRAVPEPSKRLLEGLDTLVLGALRHRPHATHFTVAEALELVAELRPRQTFLTHLSHDLDYETTERELPDGVHLAYDGLVLDVPEE